MGKEKYVPPSEGEIEKNNLTPMQSEATKHRNDIFQRNMKRNEGREGGLMLLSKGISKVLKEGPFEEIYEGDIMGHKVHLEVKVSRSMSRGGIGFNVNPQHFALVVDGRQMSDTDAQTIYNKPI